MKQNLIKKSLIEGSDGEENNKLFCDIGDRIEQIEELISEINFIIGRQK